MIPGGIYTHRIRERTTRAGRLVFIMQRVVGNQDWGLDNPVDREMDVGGVRGVVERLTRRPLYGHFSSGLPVVELRWVLRVPADRPVELFDPCRRRAAA